MCNVAGEICGAVAAIKKALEKKYSSITIYYDYIGIEAWANGTWRRNKKGTQDYKEFIESKYLKAEIKEQEQKYEKRIAELENKLDEIQTIIERQFRNCSCNLIDYKSGCKSCESKYAREISLEIQKIIEGE